MSRKHFIRLAAAMKVAYLNASNDECRRVVRETINEVANVCASCNEHFNRSRFLAACGVEG